MKFHPKLDTPPPCSDPLPEARLARELSVVEYDPTAPQRGSQFMVCLRCMAAERNIRETPLQAAQELLERDHTYPEDARIGLCAKHIDVLTQAEITWVEDYRRHVRLMLMYDMADNYDWARARAEEIQAAQARSAREAEARNAKALAVSRHLDASDWRDVLAAAQNGVQLDLDRYGRLDLPLLARLAHHLMHGGTTSPFTAWDDVDWDAQAADRLLTDVERLLEIDPSMPWALIAAATGAPENIPDWVITGTSCGGDAAA